MILSDAEVITLDDTPMSPAPPECFNCRQTLNKRIKIEVISPTSTPPRPLSPEDLPQDISDYFFADYNAVMQSVYHPVEPLDNQQQQPQQGNDENNNVVNITAQYRVTDEIDEPAVWTDVFMGNPEMPIFTAEDLEYLDEIIRGEIM